jgi:hypothetical protein
MRKYFIYAMCFFMGFVFGDCAIRVAVIAWSDIAEKVSPKLDQLGDQLKDL